MKIAVFGSTGGTGLALLRQASERGHQVVALARNPQKLAGINPFEVVQGDVLDPKVVRDTIESTEAVISVLGVRLGQPPGRVRSEGTRNIVNALLAAGVERFVSVSTIGACDSLERLSLVARFLLPRIIGAARLEEAERQERIIRQTNLAWTVLRPPRLVDSPVIGRYQIGTHLRSGLNARLARADLATALLDQLESDAFVRKCPSVLAG